MSELEIVSIDLDSTVCNTDLRAEALHADESKRDWVAYSLACESDTPIWATVELIHLFARMRQPGRFEIHYVSGRDDQAMHLTVPWLQDVAKVPIDGVWLADDGSGNHVEVYGSHAAYKVARIRQVEAATGGRVVLHVDDHASVKLACEESGIPCLCVRTPAEIAAFATAGRVGLIL